MHRSVLAAAALLVLAVGALLVWITQSDGEGREELARRPGADAQGARVSSGPDGLVESASGSDDGRNDPADGVARPDGAADPPASATSGDDAPGLGAVRGRLLDEHGRPVSGRLVHLRPDDGPGGPRVRKGAETGRGGEFRARDLDAGPWVARVEPGGLLAFEVVAGEEVAITVRLRSPPRIRGVVLRRAGGEPVPRAVVIVTIRTAPRRGPAHGGEHRAVAASSRCDEDGRFDLALAAAVDGEVHARTVDGGMSPGVAVRVGWEQDVSVELVLASGRLEGIVLDDVTGEPVADAEVRTTRAGSSVVRSDEQGRFRFEGLPAGLWELRAKAEGYFGGGAARARVGGPDLRATLRLKPYGAVAGRVTDADGEAVPTGLYVTLAFRDRDPIGYLSSRVKDGEFLLENIHPGPYDVVVRRSSFRVQMEGGDPEPARVPVDVESGRTASVQVVVDD